MPKIWDVDLISPTGTSPSADIQRIIDGFNTLRSNWSDATEPAAGDRVAYMWWADTTTGLLKIRNAANTAWVTVGTLAVANLGRLGSFTQSRTGTYLADSVDRGSMILCTGTFTLFFQNATVLGDGWMCMVRNDGTGIITLDANSAELIDDALTILLQPGETAIVYCTGTALKTFRRYPPVAQNENYLMNPDFTIWQRGATLSNIGPNVYTADRWISLQSGGGVPTVLQSTTSPTVAQAGIFINSSMQRLTATVDTTITAGEYYATAQRIEGFNWRMLAQREFTLSFWIRSYKTGTYCVAFRNNAAGTPDRSYVAQYTISVVDTWEKKIITVPASPSAGTWLYTTGVGLEVAFVWAAGTTFHTTANAWQTGNFFSTSSQVNAMDTNPGDIFLTGMKLEEGPQATPLRPRMWQVEYDACQRYYQKSFTYSVTPAQAADLGAAVQFHSQITGTSNCSILIPFFTPMRTVPGVTAYNPVNANNQVHNQTDAADDSGIFMNNTVNSLSIRFTPNAANTVGDRHIVHWTADAEL